MKQIYEIPEGCTRISIEKIDNTIVTTFEPEIPEYKKGDIISKNDYTFILDHIDDDGTVYFKDYFLKKR